MLVVCVVTAAAVCPLDPGQKTLRRSPGDGGFQITISGDPTSFVAQSVYVGKNLSIYVHHQFEIYDRLFQSQAPHRPHIIFQPYHKYYMSGNKYGGIIFSTADEQVGCHSK